MDPAVGSAGKDLVHDYKILYHFLCLKLFVSYRAANLDAVDAIDANMQGFAYASSIPMYVHKTYAKLQAPRQPSTKYMSAFIAIQDAVKLSHLLNHIHFLPLSVDWSSYTLRYVLNTA